MARGAAARAHIETSSPAPHDAGMAMPSDATRIIGLLLGDAREDAGLPQSAAAKVLGVPQSRIAKLELGRRQLQFLEAVLLAGLYDRKFEYALVNHAAAPAAVTNTS